jgi:hypothetical protein
MRLPVNFLVSMKKRGRPSQAIAEPSCQGAWLHPRVQFYDSQVSYAEPAKWVARLRARKTDLRDLLLRTDMNSGHEGRSGRGGSTRRSAEIMGWLIAHAYELTLR